MAKPYRAAVALTPLQGSRFWLILPVFGIGLAAYFVALIVTPETDLTRRQIISEAGQLSSLLIVLSLCLWASTRAPAGRESWAWRCFALAFATYTVAEAIFGYESIAIFHQNTPTPTLADGFYLPFYPLMAVGLLLLPPAAARGISQVRAVVDAAIAVAAVLGFALIYIIGPNLLSSNGPITVAFLVAYPVGDSILVLAVFLLLTRGVQDRYRPIFFFLVIGLLVFIYADVSFDYLGLQNSYTVGALNVDPFWAIGELVMSLAPLYYLTHNEQPNGAFDWLQGIAAPGTSASFTGAFQRLVLPYLSVAILLVLLILNQPPIPAQNFFGLLEVLSLVVVVLIVVRQILIGRDLVDAQVANAQAQQLDELKNQFITSVNHELRTPLMTMQAYVELLRAQQTDMDAQLRTTVIGEVGQTSDALVDLVQSILEVRRLDQDTKDFPREAVPLANALERAIALINPREGRMAERELRVDIPRTAIIWGEPVRVQQILTNLLSNALKYSPPLTPIEVSAQIVPAAKVLRKRRDRRQMVEIIVRDYGLGIPPNQIGLLFRRFVRLPRDLASNVVGSGLGLDLCRTLAEAMDGTIWVESTGIPGEGSAFHVVLPQAIQTPVSADADTLPKTRAIARGAVRM